MPNTSIIDKATLRTAALPPSDDDTLDLLDFSIESKYPPGALTVPLFVDEEVLLILSR
jgi:hypothetical protein